MRKTLIILAAVAIVGLVPTLLLALGGFHPDGPIEKPREDFPAVVLKVANLPQRTLGYFVNATDIFHYRGTTTHLSRALEILAPEASLPVTVVLHAGGSGVPEILGERKEPYDWSVGVYTTSWSRPEIRPKDTDAAQFVRVEVYLGTAIDLKSLEVPARFAVESGGEIEAFIRARAGAAEPAPESPRRDEQP